MLLPSFCLFSLFVFICFLNLSLTHRSAKAILHKRQPHCQKKKKRNETNQNKRDKNKQTTKTVDAYAFGNMFFNFLLLEKTETFCCTFIEAYSVTCSFASHVYIHIHYQENSTAIKNSVITVKWMLGSNRNSRCLSRVLQTWRACSTLCFQIATRAARTALLFFFA